jgi:hypothetical protein
MGPRLPLKVEKTTKRGLTKEEKRRPNRSHRRKSDCGGENRLRRIAIMQRAAIE